MITLETDRLLLKSSDASLAQEVLDFYKRNLSDFETYEPFDTPDFLTLAVQKRNLSLESRLQDEGRMIRFWFYLKENPDYVIGTCSFMNIRRGSFCSASLGYKLEKSFRQNGYTYEAISFCTDYVNSLFNLHRIEATVKPTNAASIKLLKKMGYKKEGLLKQNVKLNGIWTNHLLYAKIFD